MFVVCMVLSRVLMMLLLGRLSRWLRFSIMVVWVNSCGVVCMWCFSLLYSVVVLGWCMCM